MDYQKLKTELTEDPLGRGYPAMGDSIASERIMVEDRPFVDTRRIDERDILAEFPTPAEGEAFLQKLEEMAKTNTLIARMLRWIRPGGEGLDVGNNAVREMLDGLIGVSGVTQSEIDTTKGMAESLISRAAELKLGYAAARHIRDARAN